jgi:hypothetical protein
VVMITSSPYPGGGRHAFAARMPETRDGGLRTSCETWRVRFAVVSRSRSCRRSSQAAEYCCGIAIRTLGDKRQSVFSAWRLIGLAPLHTNQPGRQAVNPSINYTLCLVPALLLPALPPALVTRLPSRIHRVSSIHLAHRSRRIRPPPANAHAPTTSSSIAHSHHRRHRHHHP